MLVLFETAAGYAIFKLLDEKKLSQTDDLYKDFASPESACKVVKLKHFEKFEDTTEALAAMTACVEGKLSKSLKKTIKKHVGTEMKDSLLISDPKLSQAIKEKFNLQCVTNTAVHELMRCIRSQLESLLAGFPKKEMTAMSLGLAHSLSRYKLKFSPDKIDTMIIQAIGLLDELDKELNNYIMRCREWYGWHFPELGKIITDNLTFVKTVKLVGTRDHAVGSDLSDILPEDVEEKVKEAAEISMGTEISDEDILKIQHLCDQVIDISSYRTQLYEYLKARMMAMAPNFTVLVGELVGARLISHAGSLVNLAKLPASTIQILGAEKALFRALKTKKETPKYGLIYHTQLVGQSSVKNKGKMSRMLGAKAALAVRVDALGEDVSFELGAAHKATLESRLRILEENNLKRISGTGKAKAKFEKYHGVSEIKQYQDADDSTIPTTSKRKRSELEEIKTEPVDSAETTPKQKKKKAKKEGVEVKEEPEDDAEAQEESAETSQKKKKKKKKRQDEGDESQPEKKSRSSGESAEEEFVPVTPKSEPETPKSEKKKKKKKSISEQPDSSETADSSVMETPKSDKKKKKSESESTSPTDDSVREKKKKKKKSKDVVEQEDE